MPYQEVPMTEVLGFVKALGFAPKSQHQAYLIYRAMWKARGGEAYATADNKPKAAMCFGWSQRTGKYQPARRNLHFSTVRLWLPSEPSPLMKLVGIQ